MVNENKIKIAIVDHSPDLGGAESSIITLLKKMDRSQFDPEAIVPYRGRFSEALEAIDVPVTMIPLPMGLIRLKRGQLLRSLVLLFIYFFSIHFFILRLSLYLKKSRFRLIMTNTVKAHLYGSVAARFCSIPLVWRFHDILSPSDFSPLVIRLVGVFGRLFPKRIFAVSKITKDHLIKSGITGQKIEVLFNSLDTQRLGRNAFSSIREEYHLGDEVKLIGCIGRIIPQKGQKVLLSVIPGVIERFPKTFFLVVGDIFLKQEAYKKELLEMVKRNKMEEKVRLTGFRPDIGNVIRSLDLVIFPSIAPEAFPLSIVEAMWLGKPVIASNVGGIGEIIEDGVSGILVEPNRPEQISEKISYLFTHQDICDRIGKQATEAVRKFSADDYVKGLEKAFREAAANG